VFTRFHSSTIDREKGSTHLTKKKKFKQKSPKNLFFQKIFPLLKIILFTPKTMIFCDIFAKITSELILLKKSHF
jgi:hypothetical protein